MDRPASPTGGLRLQRLPDQGSSGSAFSLRVRQSVYRSASAAPGGGVAVGFALLDGVLDRLRGSAKPLLDPFEARHHGDGWTLRAHRARVLFRGTGVHGFARVTKAESDCRPVRVRLRHARAAPCPALPVSTKRPRWITASTVKSRRLLASAALLISPARQRAPHDAQPEALPEVTSCSRAEQAGGKARIRFDE